MGQEYELKFAATEVQQQNLFAAFGPWQRYDMETTYYDTPSRSLSQQHITLRRRFENGISVCTVKTPLAGSARGEWECQWDDIHTAIDKLCAMGAPQLIAELTQEGLVAVCGARFTRHACEISCDGAVGELALDQGILMGGAKTQPLREVEVELKSGSADAIQAFAAAMAAQYGLVPEGQSKFRRSLALAEGE
jgi:inorganic triphosphatase YgiF